MWFIIGIIVSIIAAIVVLPLLWYSEPCEDIRNFINGKNYDGGFLACGCLVLFLLVPLFMIVTIFIWPLVFVAGVIAGILWGLRFRSIIKEKLKND